MISFNKGNRWYGKIATMTEWNQHGERLVEIAKTCAEQAAAQDESYAALEYTAYMEEFKKVNAEHNAAGHLAFGLCLRRNALANELNKRIAWDFGEAVAAKIRKN